MSAPVTLANLFGDWNPMLVGLLPAIGLALIVVGLFSSLRSRQRRNASRLTAREEMERLRQKGAVKGDLEHLMVEIEQLAKRMGAQLDAKAVQIETLLQEADGRIAELRRLQEQPVHRPAATPPVHEEEPADPLARRVCDLANAGLSPVEIARQLDEHVGKVELILALRKG